MAAKLVKKKAGFESIELFKDQIIGIGAFGAVCHAQCDDLPCAAKILDSTIFSIAGPYKNAQRFEQECKFIHTVQHPNIVQYLGIHYDKITGQPVLLMEMMDENLTHFLESSPYKVPYHLQVNLSRDIVLALSYLHSNGIIHRNLSGNNVLLISNVRAKVSDFGMARLSSFNPKRSFLVHTMSSTKLPYMPPEGLRNNPYYDVKIDCFSFGVVAIQIMTRKFPCPIDHHKPPDAEYDDCMQSYYVNIPEIERRKGHISEIDPNHPLLQIALPCLSNDSTQRPSAKELYKKMKKLQENDKYCKSVSDSWKSKQSGAPSKGENSEKRSNELEGNQLTSDEDADISGSNQGQMISNTNKASDSYYVPEENVEEHHDGPIDGAEDPEAQDVIVIAAEVHTKEDETSPEQNSPNKKANHSEQHPNNRQDCKQKSLKVSGFDKDEETVGESVPKVQGSKPGGSSEKFIEEKVIPSPRLNSANKNGDQSCKSMHEIDKHIEDEEISKPVENENTESHRDSPQHENGAEEKLRSKEESGPRHIVQTAVTTDVKREESEDTVQDSGHEDVQQEMQENGDDIMMNKKEERKPVQNVDTDLEDTLQEIKHDNASATEQRKEERKHGAEQPELGNECDDVIVTQQPKQESKQYDAQPDQENKQKAREGKEVQTHSGTVMVNNSPEITILSADSDEGATSSSKGEKSVKEHHDSPIDGAEDPEAQDVIIIAAEVHTMEDETLREWNTSSEKAKASDQHPRNHHDHKWKLQRAGGFDQDEVTATGESLPKSQDTKSEKNNKADLGLEKVQDDAKAKEGKELQTYSGAEMVNDSPEITIKFLPRATGYDEGATKSEGSSEGETGKKRKRKFTWLWRQKKSKSKKDTKKESRKEKKDTKHEGDKKKKKASTSKKKQRKRNRKRDRKHMRTVMIGLDAAGKTTTLYKLKLGETVSTIPTIGFNVESIFYRKMSLTIWDVGGGDKIRPLWRHYFANTDALIFVVDSNDSERIDEARYEFHRAIKEEEIRDAIILVLANKQDLPNALSAAEIQEKMGLPSLHDRNWYIQPTCATSGEGLYEGLELLRSQHRGKEYDPKKIKYKYS